MQVISSLFEAAAFGPRALARGSSKPRRRRPHLAVGISPWNAAPGEQCGLASVV